MCHSLRLRFVVIFGLIAAFVAFPSFAAMSSSVTSEPWGLAIGGKQVYLYTLTNINGVVAKISNYGGTVTSLLIPDKNGTLGDVVLGHDTAAPYEVNAGGTYFGALIGRYGNRIRKGHFVLDGKSYQLAINNAPNSLHGGKVGFNERVWKAVPKDTAIGPSLTLTYLSPNGEEHYPGNLHMTVVYTLLNSNGLKIDYTATSDADTIVNLTNHSYFNLDGAGNGDILNHTITINADKYTPIDSTFIPTGEILPVDGTPFDFRTPHTIGSRIGEGNQQLVFAKGYDHNFVLTRKKAGDLEFAAEAVGPESGRVMDVYTTQPGIQFYTGNFLDGSEIGKGGTRYHLRFGFCFETQHFPDSPNEPLFPTTILKPGQTYHQITIYKFKTQ